MKAQKNRKYSKLESPVHMLPGRISQAEISQAGGLA